MALLEVYAHEFVPEYRESCHLDTAGGKLTTLVRNGVSQFDLQRVVAPTSCVAQVGIL
jgi:hypothetical protein